MLYILRIRDSPLGTATRLEAGQSEVRNSKTSRPALGPSQHFGVLPRTQNGRSVILTVHLRLGPKLRMSGAIPLVPPPLYVFIARTGTSSLLENLFSIRHVHFTDTKSHITGRFKTVYYNTFTSKPLP